MDIIGKRRIWFAISLLIIIPGIISMAFKWVTVGLPLNLGIDFTGGNLINIEFKNDVTVIQLRDALGEIGLEKSSIQMSGSRAAIIRTVVLDDEKQAGLLSILKEKVGPYDEGKMSISKIGPTIGKELTRNAIVALLIASVLMVIYISFRFEFKFGISAIIALLHDVLVTLGIFSLFWWEVDSTFVAAVLTIIGYSINDTIVIFDRIRENLNKRKKGEDLAQLVNKSIMQTLVRSINTVLTVIFVLVALLVFGGTTIKIFTLALLIGVVSGAYSSIFNASPLWFVLKGVGKSRA
ncbi:protein translocase subunit SecF [Phosphitispora sp. TUW77]|uniref:protein translocase subunit SecF n=1 Tax=Phosphitispora sp. TUW77 TaxID=3152361 RepID=UPI003AB126A4